MTNEDTIGAIGTPPGSGGIGIVRLSGPQAWQVGLAVLKPNKPLPEEQPEPRRMILCMAKDPGDGEEIDQVLAVFFRGPASYTGEDAVEIQGHGGQAVMNRILQAALQAGARLALPGEFTQRAFLNGRMDLSQAEAVAELIAAAGEGEARLAMAGLAGGLSRRLRPVRQALTTAAAMLEAAIDFPEETEEDGQYPEATELEREVVEPLDELLNQRERWAVYREGATVVLAGRPNVGKSSLFNALLGRERAIVSQRPGTTRDTLEEGAILGGVSCHLVDTAGMGESGDELENLGQKRAANSLASARLPLVVLDASQPLTEEDYRILALTAGRPRVIAVNKSDLRTAWRLYELGGDVLHSVCVSAADGYGLGKLARMIGEELTGGESPPLAGQAVANARQAACLRRCKKATMRAMKALQKGQSAPELASLDLQEALAALGELDGEGAPDQVIDAVFEKFCLGK